jgi:hypothetical protein
VLINEGGASVVLGDVADVVDGPEPAISAALVDGKFGRAEEVVAQDDAVLGKPGPQLGEGRLDPGRGLDPSPSCGPGLPRTASSCATTSSARPNSSPRPPAMSAHRSSSGRPACRRPGRR